MKTAQYLAMLISLLLSNIGISQDKIFMKNGEEIVAFVVEKSDRYVKYKIMDTDNSPVIIVRTEKVEKVIFRNGKEMILPDLIRMNRRFGVNGGLIFGLTEESVFFTIGSDYFLTPGISVGLNGLVAAEGGGGIELGGKYFFDPYNPRKLKGYTGMIVGVSNSQLFLQVPFGVNYIGEKGFDFKLGLRGFYAPTNNTYSLYSDLTLGWRF